ncbi:hypothetical protein BH18THE2_BH18THE2_33750 [soil metagenome]
MLGNPNTIKFIVKNKRIEVDPETNRVNKPQDEEDNFYFM